MNSSIVIPCLRALHETQHYRANDVVQMLDVYSVRVVELSGAYGVDEQCCENYDI